MSRDANMINTLVEIGVSPIDEHNTQLLDNVHPANWVDAEPDGVSLTKRNWIGFSFHRCLQEISSSDMLKWWQVSPLQVTIYHRLRSGAAFRGSLVLGKEKRA